MNVDLILDILTVLVILLCFCGIIFRKALWNLKLKKFSNSYDAEVDTIVKRLVLEGYEEELKSKSYDELKDMCIYNLNEYNNESTQKKHNENIYESAKLKILVKVFENKNEE